MSLVGGLKKFSLLNREAAVWSLTTWSLRGAIATRITRMPGFLGAAADKASRWELFGTLTVVQALGLIAFG
jgi:hypothetical protein